MSRQRQISVARRLGVVARPGGVSQALSSASNDAEWGERLAACALAAGEAAVLGYAARAQARWRG
jgi:hypothetical protein